MIFVPKKNIYFPKYIYKSKFHQRGNFAIFPAGTIGQIGAIPGIDPTTGWLVTDIQANPTTATAGFEIDADGGIETYKSTGNQGDVGRWDGGSMGGLNKIDYQFRFDESGPGSISGDATNVWLAASAGLDNWQVTVVGGTNTVNTGTLRIRLAASPFTEYASSTVITLTAISSF